MSLEKYKEQFDFPVKDYYEKIGFDFEKESFEIVGTEFITEYDKRQKTSKLYPGVEELLSEIKSSGIKQSILSEYYLSAHHSICDHLYIRFVLRGLSCP